MKIFAFSDEAASELSGQIAAMKRNGLDGTEIRGVNGRSIVKHTVEEAREILRQLKDNGLSVWSVGSPIGKIPLDGGGFPEHLDLLRHTLELAAALECRNLRMFSFYLPEGADWTLWHTGETFKGGQTVTVDAPLDQLPVFTKDDFRLEV